MKALRQRNKEERERIRTERQARLEAAYKANHCTCGRVLGKANRLKGVASCTPCQQTQAMAGTWAFFRTWLSPA